ncbi:hypothetical protein AAF712_009811 [Marasmius tenuissimus]|uniref:Uncharacterized protein n=1 Tax=Marasmius tenuissimus TaxID=585030 RepID=A0ABR2ZQH5_9AGAR
MSSEQPRPNQDSRDGNVQAAIARSATRAIALYYSRPVRFFRPSKVSGWQMLRGIASQDGVGLSPQFVRSLVQAQGFTVIAKHFVPPILVNTLLGTILFTTYTEATQILEPHIGHHPTLTAAVAGGIAGGAQALVAAPAENVRTLVEGGTVYHSWSHAWKDVFRGTETRAGLSKTEALEDVREVRRWMKEVGEMAGRGWNGWGWTCVKDISGFAVFFSMFSLTKRIAGEARVRSEAIVERRTNKVSLENIPRVLYGCLLVAGGGCAETDKHTSETPEVEPSASSTASQPNIVTEGKPITSISEPPKTNSTPTVLVNQKPPTALPPPPLIEEEDDPDIAVELGTACKRKGCTTTFVSDEVNRKGDGEGTKCVYHPMPPIFREGSKGYLCCKRRVLEFEEFLKIEGCKTGRHVFAPKINTSTAEELTTCRVDHYQTLDKVYVSIFAKKAEKETSEISFEENSVSVDLRLPGSKRFVKTIELFGPIEPSASVFQFFGTKVELTLKKQDNRSWTILEKPAHDLGGISLTFGVSGRTGTVGAKESVLDEQNRKR